MISLVFGLMCQSCKQWTGLYYIFLYFILSFLFSFFIYKKSGITSHVTVTQVTKCDRNVTHFTVMVTPSCSTKKIIESSRIDNVI